MHGLHEALHNFRLARMLPFIFAEFTGIIIERPKLGNLHRNKLDDYIHWFQSLKVVGEVGTDTEAGLAVVFCVALDFDGAVGVEGIAEYHLLGAGVDSQGSVFVGDFL